MPNCFTELFSSYKGLYCLPSAGSSLCIPSKDSLQFSHRCLSTRKGSGTLLSSPFPTGQLWAELPSSLGLAVWEPSASQLCWEPSPVTQELLWEPASKHWFCSVLWEGSNTFRRWTSQRWIKQTLFYGLQKWVTEHLQGTKMKPTELPNYTVLLKIKLFFSP